MYASRLTLNLSWPWLCALSLLLLLASPLGAADLADEAQAADEVQTAPQPMADTAVPADNGENKEASQVPQSIDAAADADVKRQAAAQNADAAGATPVTTEPSADDVASSQEDTDRDADADVSSKSVSGPKSNTIEKGRRDRRSADSDATEQASAALADDDPQGPADKREEHGASPKTQQHVQRRCVIHLLDFGATWLLWGQELAEIQEGEAMLLIPALSMQTQVQVLANDGKFIMLGGKQLSLFKAHKQDLNSLVLEQAQVTSQQHNQETTNK